MRKPCSLLPLLGLLLGGVAATASQTAQAAEVTRVATAFEEGNQFDIHFGVAYDFSFKRAAILREWNAGPGDTSTGLVKDLLYRQQRHTVLPTMEIGLWHDLAIYAALQLPGGDAMVARLAGISIALSLFALILSESLARRGHRHRGGDNGA